MNHPADVIAIDLGASTGRMVAGRWDGQTLRTEELHRFPNRGVQVTDSLRWDVLRIWTEIQDGLRSYSAKFDGAPRSIGIDSWGVDYALLDRRGQLISNPYHYRDRRTENITEELEKIIGASDLFSRNGIQPSSINTLAQLYSMVLRDDDALRVAAKLLMIPDLIQYFLTGYMASEGSIASTTQMLRIDSMGWDEKLVRAIGISPAILPELVRQGSSFREIGSLQSQ